MRYCEIRYWQRIRNECRSGRVFLFTAMFSLLLFSQVLFVFPLAGAELARDEVYSVGDSHDPLLLKAATELFAGIGGSFKVKLLAETELYAQGLHYRMYGVTSQSSNIGEFTRITIFGNGGEMIDAAVRFSNGTVLKAVAVKPLSFSDSDDEFSLNSLLRHLKGIRAERYGVSMSTLFDGLSYLPSVLSGALEKKQKLIAREPAAISMKVSMPSPVMGEPCPHFSARSVDGASLSPFTFKGKAFLLFTGSLRNAMSIEMRNILYDIVPFSEGKVGFIEAYENRNWLVMEQMRLGIEFKGRVVADPEGAIKKTLQVPYIPYLLGYDKEHRLIMMAPYKGRVEVIKKLRAYFEKVEKEGL